MQKGLFISVEGIDGAGKSTHVTFIQEYLQKRGLEVKVTREPGGTPLGESIRDLLLHSYDTIHSRTELFLMFASRQELIDKVILPNLNQGICIIADRFIDASIAYQGYGRKIGENNVAKMISLLEPSLQTDLTFIFDVPLNLAITRVSRNKNKDRIEKEDKNFFATVQHAYHNIAQNEPMRVKIIQTNQTIDKTQCDLAAYLDQLLRIKNVN